MADPAATSEPGSQGVDLRDMVGLAGGVLLSAGAAMIYLPLGLIVPGALLLAIALVGVARR